MTDRGTASGAGIKALRSTKAIGLPRSLTTTMECQVMVATEYPSDLVELALAHTISSKVEAAYRRRDMIEKMLASMEDWAKHCNTAKT